MRCVATCASSCATVSRESAIEGSTKTTAWAGIASPSASASLLTVAEDESLEEKVAREEKTLLAAGILRGPRVATPVPVWR